MLKIDPVPNSLSIEENKLCVWLNLDPQLDWFKGHFPKQPILPGVIQVEWALHYSKVLLGPLTLKSIKQVKFTMPLIPTKKVLLEIKAEGATNTKTVSFAYSVPKEEGSRVASQGKLEVCL